MRVCWSLLLLYRQRNWRGVGQRPRCGGDGDRVGSSRCARVAISTGRAAASARRHEDQPREYQEYQEHSQELFPSRTEALSQQRQAANRQPHGIENPTRGRE